MATMIGESLETVIRTSSHVNNNMMDAAIKIARTYDWLYFISVLFL